MSSSPTKTVILGRAGLNRVFVRFSSLLPTPDTWRAPLVKQIVATMPKMKLDLR